MMKDYLMIDWPIRILFLNIQELKIRLGATGLGWGRSLWAQEEEAIAIKTASEVVEKEKE